MTVSPDMLFQLGGAPVGGGIPVQWSGGSSGTAAEPRYYFVDGKYGDDGKDGRAPERAVQTIAQAISLARARVDWSATPWGKRDSILIAPGTYAENLTNLAHGVNFVGMGHDVRDAQLGVKIKPATGSPVVVGAIVNSAFYNIGFETGDGAAGSYAFDGGIVNNCRFENCFFTGPAETATIAAAFYTCDSVKTTWKNCWFCNADRGFMANYEDGGDSFSYALLEDCLFTGIDTAGMYISLNLVGPHSMMRRCDFAGAGQTMALGLDDNVDILNCSFCTFEATANDPASGAGKYNGCYLNGALIT